MTRYVGAVACLLCTLATSGAWADEDLAEELANPFATLSSVKLQLNYDHAVGPRQAGERYYLNIQALVPFRLNDEWSLITRTDFVEFDQDKIFPGSGHQLGLSDAVQSFFLSPANQTSSGLVWGAGVIVLYPLATQRRLGSEKWGAGPTVGAVIQRSNWTAGILANHIWSFAGNEQRSDISSTFVQPFVSYKSGPWTLSLNEQSTYDWQKRQWTVPVNATVSRLIRVGSQPLSIFAGLRYWAQSPTAAAHHWGATAGITLLFPKSKP